MPTTASLGWSPPRRAICAAKGVTVTRAVRDTRPLDEVRNDLEVFKKLRKSDCMSIAGGDPLVYPYIVELVKMVKEMGWKAHCKHQWHCTR